MVSIIIPPVSDCFMPTLGAAQLAAYLKRQEIAAKLYDLSAELQTVLLQQGETLPKVCGGLEDSDTSAVHRYATVTNALFGDDSTPFQISYDSFTSRWDWKVPNDLTDLLSTHAELLPYIEQLPSLSELETSTYAAFSVSFESQIIPALLIAARLRRQRKIPVIFGGSFFYNYAEVFLKLMSALDLVDCLIIGPGERILEAIGKSGIRETACSDQFAASTVFGKTLLRQKSGERCPEVYLPDFTDLDFSRYFSPVKAFPYMIRNICYYGGCRFCNGDRDCGAVQSKDIRQAFLSMSKIAKADNIHNVYIVDAGLSPHDLQTISAMETPVPFSWIANARFERELDREELIQGLCHKGCCMLRFGLESGSQRILDLMNKGTEVSVAASILQKLHDVGILTHVYLMFGYLGETNEDRAETLRFLEQNRCSISSYSVSIFQPIPGTPVYEEIRSGLRLPTSCSADEEYQRILAEIYPSESTYQDILQAVEKVKSVLAGYAHTNAEFYSANIFSAEQCRTEMDDVLSIQFVPL
ncbi:MAG: radical SAM protein [Lachnospiraceae bacterium]|nr:radical SAM protein [Lachnospiraceae bacterium]